MVSSKKKIIIRWFRLWFYKKQNMLDPGENFDRFLFCFYSLCVLRSCKLFFQWFLIFCLHIVYYCRDCFVWLSSRFIHLFCFDINKFCRIGKGFFYILDKECHVSRFYWLESFFFFNLVGTDLGDDILRHSQLCFDSCRIQHLFGELIKKRRRITQPAQDV